MRTLKFKCTLLTDVILNRKSTSEGLNQTLDFVPGNVFLGIAAGALYKQLDSAEAWRVFHSSAIRFGDAHPLVGNHRALHVPAALYSPKLGNGSAFYVHHRIPDPSAEELRKAQLKQERKGYVDFCGLDSKGNGCAVRMPMTSSFAIKSGYDRKLRKSKDEQLFGFQSLNKGQIFCFKVEIDEELEAFADRLEKALVGVKRIGHSRSSEYGQVAIQPFDFKEVASAPDGETDELVVYADSRIVLTDLDGASTVQIDSEQLIGQICPKSLEGEICWDKCQVGLFKYTPYNHKRNCFDAERYGFEKGSVWVIKLERPVAFAALNNWIGAYRNEGFGKVIFNPAFLNADRQGKTVYCIEEYQPEQEEKEALPRRDDVNTPLFVYLRRCQAETKIRERVYKAVEDWVQQYAFLFCGETFAAQWGSIRRFAEQSRSREELENFLFQEGKGYLVHGVAKEKWVDKLGLLEKFIRDNKNEAVLAVINLSEVMQKRVAASEK